MKIPDFKQSDKKYLTLKTSTFISLNLIAARTKSSKSTGISGLTYKTSFGPVEMFNLCFLVLKCEVYFVAHRYVEIFVIFCTKIRLLFSLLPEINVKQLRLSIKPGFNT